jgi:hypothetical protein
MSAAWYLKVGIKRSQVFKVRQCDFFRNLIVFDKTKSGRPRIVEMNSEVREILLPLCKGKCPDDYVWINPMPSKRFTDIKHSFVSACFDAKIEGLVWHDLRATWHQVGRGWIQCLRHSQTGHANISTSQSYFRNLPVGSGEAVSQKISVVAIPSQVSIRIR